MKRLLLISAAALFAACLSDPKSESNTADIQGGRPTADYEAVGVVHQSLAQSFCSGTLIAPDIVLTAGHCIEEEGERIDAFFTGVGKASLDDSTDPASLGMVRHEVAEQIRFPTFEYFYSCPNPELDVALLRLKTPIRDIEPIAIGGPPTNEATCTTVGFGTHDTDAGAEFLEKRSATVKIIEVRETTVDVLPGSGISGHGDSGGPLLCDGVLVGTTSCQPDWPPEAVTYGNISAGLSWIRSMIQKWEPGDAQP